LLLPLSLQRCNTAAMVTARMRGYSWSREKVWPVVLAVAFFGSSCAAGVQGEPIEDEDESGEAPTGSPPRKTSDTGTPSTSGGSAGAGGSAGGGSVPADASTARADAGVGPADALGSDSAPMQPAEPQCAPAGGGPYWVEEGAPVKFTVSCQSGKELPGEAFKLTNLPTGASYDPASRAVTWTPKLNQAAVYLIEISVPQYDEHGQVKVGVADKFDDPMNDPKVDPKTYTEEFGLPVMHLTTASNISRTTYSPAKIVYRGHSFTMPLAKYRGASSFGYPKKNFTLKFDKEDKFGEPNVLGFVKRRKIALITTFDDNSQVRYRMALELWNRMDPMNIQVKNYHLVLFLNGRYHGVYAFSDKIDHNLMQRHGLAETGNIFMARNHNGNFASWRYDEPRPQNQSIQKTSMSEGYKKKDGLPAEGSAGAFDDIAQLVRFVATSDNTRFTAEIGKRMDLRDVYNWIIHCTAIQAWDTLGKNSLHYHDPMGDGPWRIILWDFNESFGQRWQTARFLQMIDPKDVIYQASGGFGYTNRNWLWRRLWNDATFGKEVRARYGMIIRTSLSYEVVSEVFEEMVKQTQAAAPRDERRWRSQYRSYFKRSDYTTYEQEVALVRKWIKDRWTYLRGRY
jgi:spore coat protein H